MTTGKVLSIIFSVILILALAFAITWGVINWSKIKEGMKGNGLYTQEDINNAYQDGYDAALNDKIEYDALLDEYRDTITTLTDQISQLNSEISTLTKSNNALELEIIGLTQIKEGLEAQVENLLSNKADNEATIVALNNQIIGLETQIETLKLQIQNHNTVVSSLNKTVADLQASIEYYEQYIATLETGDTVVATFEFDGKVYSIQVVTKGSTITIADPPSTEGVIFNGWTVNGQPVTLSEYPVTSNTKFVADVSYKYVVKFTVDGVIKSTQLVDRGKYAETPSSPKKANYTFKYWTLDGTNEVQLDKYPITCDTTFIAKFAKLYTVTFQYADGTEIVSRRIEEGTTTNPARISDLPDGAVLNGWKLNGYFVDVASHVINQDTVFVADITYYYTVVFKNGNSTVSTQQVEAGKYASVPANPTKPDHEFVGWSLDGETTVNISNYAITENTTFTAIFVEIEVGNYIYIDFEALGNSDLTTLVIDCVSKAKAGDTVTFSIRMTDKTAYGGYQLEIGRVSIEDYEGEEVYDELDEIYGNWSMDKVGKDYYFSFTIPEDYDFNTIVVKIYLTEV